MAGTKPEALHTEYAEGGSYSGSYHGELVFYLQRADGGGNSDNQLEDPISGVEDTVWDEYSGKQLPADEANPLYDSAESVWNQVAAGESAGGTNGQSGNVAGPGAPPSGRSVPPGKLTPNAVGFVNLESTLANLFQTVNSFEKTERTFSFSSSEHFFGEVLDDAFNPDGDRDILGALERGSRSDLAVRLARATGGVANTEDFVEGINIGAFGLTSQKSKAATALTSRNAGRSHRSFR